MSFLIISRKTLIGPWCLAPKCKYFSPILPGLEMRPWTLAIRSPRSGGGGGVGRGTQGPAWLRGYSDISYLPLGFPVPFNIHMGRPVIHSHRRATPCKMGLTGWCVSVRTVSLGSLSSLKTFPGPKTQENSTWWGYKTKEDGWEWLPCFC